MIALGEYQKVQTFFSGLNYSKIPLRYKAKVANLARRAGLPKVSLLILNPVVRSKDTGELQGDDEQKLQYAAALIRIGVLEEGMAICQSFNVEKHPMALFYQALGHFAQWDYLKATPLLEKLIESNKISDFEKRIGKLNLALSLVDGRDLDNATNLLEELLDQAKTQGQNVIYSNCLLLKAQNLVNQKKYQDALRVLDQARDILGESYSVSHLLVDKWAVMCRIYLSPNEKNFSQLSLLREKSQTMSNWETTRHLDLFKSVLQKDSSLFYHVYFGTPFSTFREEMIKDYEEAIIIPKHYYWPKESEKFFDLSIDQPKKQKVNLKEGQIPHRLMSTLLEDFYKPLTCDQLFAKVFPDEYYNPISSPERVYQAINRLKSFYDEYSIPLFIDSEKGFYRLISEGDYSVRVGKTQQSLPIRDMHDARLNKVFDHFKQRPHFTSKQVSELLNISQSTASRLLNKAIEAGAIKKVPLGRSSRYEWADSDLELSKVA